MTTTEHHFATEGEAASARRAFIAQGVAVSLATMDTRPQHAAAPFMFDTYAPECGRVRPGTLGYQRCWLDRDHKGDHKAQDGGEWCGNCGWCNSRQCHWAPEDRTNPPRPDFTGARLVEDATQVYNLPNGGHMSKPYWTVRCDHPSHGPIVLNSGHHYGADVRHLAQRLADEHNSTDHGLVTELHAGGK